MSGWVEDDGAWSGGGVVDDVLALGAVDDDFLGWPPGLLPGVAPDVRTRADVSRWQTSS